MESARSWAPARLEALFRHYPHSQVIAEVLLKAMDSVYSLAMLEVILDAKPRQVVTPVSPAIACGATEKASECTALALKRFQAQNIGEDTMLQIVDKCWPNSLMTVLSQRPGAVELLRASLRDFAKVIRMLEMSGAKLMERMHSPCC